MTDKEMLELYNNPKKISGASSSPFLSSVPTAQNRQNSSPFLSSVSPTQNTLTQSPALTQKEKTMSSLQPNLSNPALSANPSTPVQAQESPLTKEYYDYMNKLAAPAKQTSGSGYDDIYDESKQLLDTNLANQQAGLTQAQKNAQQGASISYDKIMKYLEQSSLASGAATGQVGSNFINANNSYMQNRAGIANDFSAQQAELLQRYAEGNLQIKTDAYNRKYTEEQNALQQENWLKQFGLSLEQFEEDKKNNEFNRNMTLEEWAYGKLRDEEMDSRYYDERDYEREQTEWMKQNGTKDDQFAYLNNLFEAEEYNSADEILSAIEQFKDSLDPWQYDYLKYRAEVVKNDPYQIELEKQKAAEKEAYDKLYGEVSDEQLTSWGIAGKAGISIDDAKAESFGKFFGGSSGGKQDKYIQKVIQAAKDGKIPNGTIIKMNYGAVSGVSSSDSAYGYYRYYNGAFYPMSDEEVNNGAGYDSFSGTKKGVVNNENFDKMIK